MFLKNRNYFDLLKNYYFLTSLIFVIIYLIKSLSFFIWDANYLYITALKSNTQNIYVDFSFQHGPYLNFFFNFLTILNKDPYPLLFILGAIQSLAIGYLGFLFTSQITNSHFVKKISFLVTIFFVNSSYNFFYWDLYSFLLSGIGFYLILVKKKIFWVFFY